MTQNQIHIPAAEMEVLARTAALGDFTLEDLVGAAAWAFEQHEDNFKNYYVRGLWLDGDSGAPRNRCSKGKFTDWHTVSVPSSTRRLLRKNARNDFSPIQKLSAAIRLYTTLEPHDRIQVASEYAARNQART
jgi:hypothetical protein